ncbi:hypothetical protein OTU49_003916 [Cherax quadricarinatus]|uniref:NACHT domain-containing protein n=1 Tax=Cherax quadricarinatus TaxID=27406 RepID=A0AAW0X5W7_CHEQU
MEEGATGGMECEEEEQNKDAINLRQCISQALKTSVRDALALLYRERFPMAHPNTRPYDVLNAHGWARTLLKRNPQMSERIKENIVDKLDVSALGILLRYGCGLSTNDKMWKNPFSLEGNIQKLRDLRNEDAHWTQTTCSKDDLETTWMQLVEAVRNVLHLGGLTKHQPKIMQQLKDIIHSSVMYLQKKIRNELLETYRNNRKTTLMPLLWAGKDYDFHHHVSKTYTSTRFTVLNDGMTIEMDGSNMLEKLASSRMIILQGETGTGKTSLLRHYAASWAANTHTNISGLTRVEYLVFLDCTAVSTATFTLSDIIQEILPNTYSISKPSTILKKLSEAQDKVMFLIDAFDERLEAFMNSFKDLQKKCSKALFVVTTRPHCTLSVTKLCEEKPVVVTAHGFSRSSAFDFATKLFKAQGKDDVKEFFNAASPYEELIAIPQLLCWSSLFWMKEGNDCFLTRGKVFAKITDFLLRKLCHINGKRIIAGALPKEGQRWLSVVARVAFTQAKNNHTSLSESSSDIQKLIESAKQLKFRPFEALSSLMQCDSYMTEKGEYNVFQFVHNSHANFLAAYNISETLQNSRTGTLTSLFQDFQEDRKKSIILFLASLLFNRDENVNTLMIKDIAKLSQAYVNFYDINFLLELIEESSYNTALIKALAKEMFGDPSVTSTGLPTASSTTAKYLFNGQLWLRPKELRHTKALRLFLSQAKPQRLLLRLCEGPHADKEIPVRGHQVLEGDAVAAMNLVNKAYGDAVLPDLRVTDVTISSSLSWPKNLWWLSLDRCHIKADFHLPSGLLKLSLLECTGLEYITFPSSFLNAYFQSMSLDKPHLPVTVETIVIESCEFKNLAFIPPGVKRLKIYSYAVTGDLVFPDSLEHLMISGITKAYWFVCEVIEYSSRFMHKLRDALSILPHLQSLSITNIALTPEAFICFLLDHQEKNPRVQLLVESLCELEEDSSMHDIIMSTIMASRLPVTVKFGDTVVVDNIVS